MKKIIHSEKWIWGRSWYFVDEDGKALIRASVEDEDNSYVFLSGLSVLLEERHKGRATDLLEYIYNYFKEQSFDRLILKVEKDKTSLIDFYKKRGYVDCLDDNFGWEDEDKYVYLERRY